MYTILYNFSLIGEFLQHSIIITVTGLLVVKLIDAVGSKRPFSETSSIYALLGVAVLAIAWDIVHFFVAEEREWLEVFELVILFSLTAMLWSVARVVTSRILQTIYISIVAFSVIYFGFEIVVQFAYNRGIILSLMLVRTIIFVLIYFFILHYLIAVKNDYAHE